MPEIVYDGMPDPQFIADDGNILDGYNLCIQNNGNAEFVNLEIDKHFEKWYSPFIAKFSQDETPFDCQLSAITPTALSVK